EGNGEITPAEGEADGEGRPQDAAPAALLFRAIEAPDPDRKGDEQGGHDEKWRDGEARNGPDEHQQPETPPAMTEHGGFSQPGHRGAFGESDCMAGKVAVTAGGVKARYVLPRLDTASAPV